LLLTISPPAPHWTRRCFQLILELCKGITAPPPILCLSSPQHILLFLPSNLSLSPLSSQCCFSDFAMKLETFSLATILLSVHSARASLPYSIPNLGTLKIEIDAIVMLTRCTKNITASFTEAPLPWSPFQPPLFLYTHPSLQRLSVQLPDVVPLQSLSHSQAHQTQPRRLVLSAPAS
jgi:hypothetical protein